MNEVTTTDCTIPATPSVAEPGMSPRQPLRYIQAVSFVGVWRGRGWARLLDTNQYLLLGVPLVAAFQLFVRKKPLVALWVRDAARFRLEPFGIILALAFAALPVIDIIQSFKSWPSSAHIVDLLWSICCVAGAVCAAFALSQFTRATWKSLGFCVATAGVIGCGIMIGGALLQKQSLVLATPKLWGGLKSFLLYFPVCFILEEVAFRGAIDSHVHQPGDRHAWLSALFVSAMWGLWHLPTSGASDVLSVITLAIVLPLIHLFDGMFLSFGWRRSGNLAVPAAVHALIDAVRNALLG
jgi:membrane protease YdiL (CAAX protease family)